jgi:hypothetical protein
MMIFENHHDFGTARHVSGKQIDHLADRVRQDRFKNKTLATRYERLSDRRCYFGRFVRADVLFKCDIIRVNEA